MSPELKSLKHQVDEWRKHKTSPRGRVPDAIKNQVIALLDRYSVSSLTELCGFGNNTIYNWKQNLVDKPSPEVSLIQIQPAALSAEKQAEPLQVVLKKGDIEVQVSMTPAQFQHAFLNTVGAAC